MLDKMKIKEEKFEKVRNWFYFWILDHFFWILSSKLINRMLMRD